MPQLIIAPTRITAAGNKPKIIEEFIGRVNNGEVRLSIAHMHSPGGWVEPAQTPAFDEFTLVLAGTLRVTHREGVLDVKAGQAVHTHAGESVQYSTPTPDGADYLAVCLPAFSPQTVHRKGAEVKRPLVSGGDARIGLPHSNQSVEMPERCHFRSIAEEAQPRSTLTT
jgi:mannose-6-phosphate isomerase-like protein (cupin superfamily)